jgi:hypothetical protein
MVHSSSPRNSYISQCNGGCEYAELPSSIIDNVISREEECVALCILSLHFGQVFIGGIFCPGACGEDVLVPLIPSSVYNLRNRWVIVEPFKLMFGYGRLFVLVFARLIEGIVNRGLVVAL